MIPSRIGYLSGAPRVSTKANAEMSGPRSHVLGIMQAFQSLDWTVQSYIVGNKVPDAWISKGSEEKVSRSFYMALSADIVRLIISKKNSWKAFDELFGKVDWVYERFGAFQAMGYRFKKHKIPWILETNALLSQESKEERKTTVLSSLLRRYESKAYRECDVLVCISERLKQKIIEEFKVPPHKIVVTPNGVDTDLVNPDKYLEKRIFPSFTIGFVGSLFPWQGLDLLLQAIENLRKDEDIAINLVVIGDGPMLESLKEMTAEMELSSQVCYLGRLPQSELFPVILGCDFCYSGHFDPHGQNTYRSPLKLYEYMSMAKPVIASDIDATKNLVCDGETGLLFSPNNLESLKKALLEAFNSRHLCDVMGEQARKIIVSSHSWKSRVEVLVKEVETILCL
ncbi:glycosyltransferase family 4 protein [Oscillatoria sp. CS-180]|uniref:glycosyltransferase family 4 protein n=1 Tax=Oscillatoria sp. CS-180 TaxID=3021720 RepID=UPI00232A7EC7|nr:glycosyltransferase family 4 protein [Oscillatoria sp. CS-180]MDB9526423.1 glycosyltransferase family 4 protein [Oscillatoria sp. CS-180]